MLLLENLLVIFVKPEFGASPTVLLRAPCRSIILPARHSRTLETTMASDRQIAANRRNAQKSTGPATSAGKAVSRMNSYRHGLTAERVVGPGEDATLFDCFRDEVSKHWQPVGIQECHQVEIISMRMWRQRRAHLLEPAIFKHDALRAKIEAASQVMMTEVDERGELLAIPELQAAGVAELASSCEEMNAIAERIGVFFSGASSALERVSRYESSNERYLYRAVAELERLQRMRRQQAIIVSAEIA